MKNKSSVSDPPDPPVDDLHALKAQLKALKQSEAFYRAITQNSSDIVIIVNKKAKITYVNPSIERLMGYPPAELIGQNAFNFFLPSEIPRALMEFSKAILARKENITNAFHIRHKDGSFRVLEGIGTNLLGDPVVKGFVMNVRDVTERKTAQEALENHHRELEAIIQNRTAEISRVNQQLLAELAERREMERALLESEETFRSFLEQAPIGVGVVDLDGTVLYINRRIEDLMGWKREEVLGTNGFTLGVFDEETLTVLIDRFAKRLQGATPIPLEIPIAREDGTRLWVELMGNILYRDDQPIGAQLVFLNVTDRKQAEAESRALVERLHQSQKMESLGTLAGGVAHDLNNVLGVLVGFTELMLVNVADDDPLKQHLRSIAKSSQKASAIIQDMLTLARRSVTVSTVVNLNALLMDYFLSPEFERLKSHHPAVTFRSKFAHDLHNTQGSPVHLSKTAMNLISNAVEAIMGEGEVTVKTYNASVTGSCPGPEAHAEGYVVLEVTDTGEGILPADRDRIFEPFYTKKVMGRSGTGLGLAVVWGAVQDHGGHIDVESEPGKGSVFRVYLPATQEAVSPIPDPVPLASYMGNGETVLVVDDVPEQRDVATHLLARLGYRVNAVQSGEEALDHLRKQSADVLIVDMLMDPGIDGLETYLRALEIRPDQKAIVVSGFTETERVRQALAFGASEYVRKPYLLDRIGTALRRALDSAPSISSGAS